MSKIIGIWEEEIVETWDEIGKVWFYIQNSILCEYLVKVMNSSILFECKFDIFWEEPCESIHDPTHIDFIWIESFYLV